MSADSLHFAGVVLVTLADGAEVEIRSLARSDRAALASAFARLSGRSRYLRFASAKPRLSERELDTLTQLDRHSSDALVATDPMTGGIVGVGRFAALRDQEGAVDVAVTVGDRWQGRGLGTALLVRLIERARDEGHLAVHATVLAENTASIVMLRRAGFVSRSGTGVLGEFELAFTQPPGPSNAPAVCRTGGRQRESLGSPRHDRTRSRRNG